MFCIELFSAFMYYQQVGWISEFSAKGGNQMERSATVFCLLIALAFICTPAFAQPPATLWTQTFGGTESDYAYGVQQTSDGGFITVGYTSSVGAGGWDAMLIKTDADGNDIWTQTFGGIDDEFGRSVQQTSDGGYIIVGDRNPYGPSGLDVWLIKTDPSGNELWSRTYGGADWDWGYSVQQTTDGGYIIVGKTESFGAGQRDVWLIKTDSTGNELWNQTFGGAFSECGYSVQQTADGGYIVTGYIYPSGFGLSDLLLIKTDQDGNLVWNQIFGATNDEFGYEVHQTTDGGYIIAGTTWSFGPGSSDAWLIKTDSTGTETWSQTYGGINFDEGRSVQQTTDGGYIVAGYTQSFGAGGTDVWLFKTDPTGTATWGQTFGGTQYDNGYSVQQTSDEGYILCGYTDSFGAGNPDFWLIRVDSDEPQLNITLTPDNPPIQIPANGGPFQYNALISNVTMNPVNFDAWTEVSAANGTTFGPILLQQNLNLPGGEQLNVVLTQNVPGFLPAGVYTYRGCVGNHPGGTWASGEFTFEKLPAAGTFDVNNWNISGWDFDYQGEQSMTSPNEFAFESIYPNPFNPTTSISVNLPDASELSVVIYNMTGQQVAELADGSFGAGTHQLMFDGSGLSSGIYFVHATVPGQMNELRKIVLMK